AEPKLADDLGAAHHYNAACAAALAGCGRGEDAAGLDETERARLRGQALDWLRIHREEFDRQLKDFLDKNPDKIPYLGSHEPRHWVWDPDFAGLRGPEALARLPEAERAPWQKLWDDVADMVNRALRKETSAKKSDAR